MKKSIILIVVLFLILVQVASAQEKKYEILVGGGIDSPLRPDEFTDGFNLGWTAKLAAGYFFTPQFNLGANLSFNRFGLDESNFVTIQNPDLSGGDLSLFELTGVGKYYILPAQRTGNVYVLAGPGVAFSRISDFTFRNIAGEVTTVEGDNETDFMFTAGAGVKYNVNPRWALFVEGRYSHLFTEDDNTSYLPIRVGVVF